MQKVKSLKDLVDEDITTDRPKSLAEQSADKLRELILLEKLPPGLALNERDLSDLLGISRTPVRDAIRLLESEGLVEYSATRRHSVADPSVETLSQWIFVQSALEALAGELACQNATDEELAQIAGFQDQMIALAGSDEDLKRFEIDMAFHCAIVAATHNVPLIETHKQYNSRLWRARFMSSRRHANSQQQMQKHQQIVDALMQRNAAEASLSLGQHLRDAIKNIKASKAEGLS